MSAPLAIVVGMGPGLGQALVRRFATDGFSVAFIGRSAPAITCHEERLRAQGLRVSGFVGDAGDPEAMERIHRRIRDELGAADALIYNAALIEPARFVTRSAIVEAKYGEAPGWAARGAPATIDYLMRAFRTNVAGAHHAAALVAPDMMARRRGSILLTGGVLAFGPWIEWGVTSLGKAALRSLGHSLHKELAEHHVQVCTIAIHGTMQPEGPYAHDRVAQAYVDLHRRPQRAWTPDFHFKPDSEGERDPDAR